MSIIVAQKQIIRRNVLNDVGNRSAVDGVNGRVVMRPVSSVEREIVEPRHAGMSRLTAFQVQTPKDFPPPV